VSFGVLAIGAIGANGDKNGANGDPMAIQWRSIGSNGDGRNGVNGAPHRHWHQWRSSLDPMAITIGDQWRHLNGSIGAMRW
jgi:hypothetical protein